MDSIPAMQPLCCKKNNLLLADATSLPYASSVNVMLRVVSCPSKRQVASYWAWSKASGEIIVGSMMSFYV